jgi:hypothetical protein
MMMRFSKVNNERSEAIELIKLMDAIAKKNTWQIKSVGGESTLNTGQQRMFPDVFIYGDNERTQILQGWEVKMPDVPINDSAFIRDAQRKADVLGVNSCFIWNFTYGVLYFNDPDSGWHKHKEWNSTAHIRTRADVASYKSDWEAGIIIILGELNNFFATGELRPAKLGEIVSDNIFAEILRRNKNVTAEHLKTESVANTIIRSFITQWWKSVEKEYRFDENDPFVAYAKFVLLNWINKITFANMIKGNHNPAAEVERIDEEMNPTEALAVFLEITSKCDFFNIFEAIAYAELLPKTTWQDLTDYNAFLTDNGIAGITQDILQSVLENSVNQFKRNVSGVFTTPPKLAEILVKSGLTDLNSICIDPCCGTGTIVKEMLSEKENAIGVERAYATTYASDKYSFALQVSNIAMVRATAINLPSLLFRSNAFDLFLGKKIPIIDPRNGEQRIFHLPEVGTVVSNLPFVAFDQEGREESCFIQHTIERVRCEGDINFSGRADLYQAILLHLPTILVENGQVAVITSNSWLGTLAGQDFFRGLNFYFFVECVIASGSGKWFDNADVVTLMLFLKKKPIPQHSAKTCRVFFGLIHKGLSELTGDDTAQIIDSIKLKRALSPELLTFRQCTLEKIDDVLGMNVALNSCFYDIEWLSSLKDTLCPVTELFDVFRGMKTGQDEIYYLRETTDIEREYVGRVFKSAKSCAYLIAQPDTFSFVCDKTLEELDSLGHAKTLAWIERFKDHINQSVPNKDVFWMNLSENRLSGSEKVRLFTGMNPERRLFYGLLDEPAQINQRAIGFSPLDSNLNLELCHALLNTVIGIFYTEATGFPKGLGALDNRAENVKKILMLDPRKISMSDADKILTSFKPLLGRKIMTTFDEFQQADRLEFEYTVAECFGYSRLFERIRDSVLDMQKVRLSVKNSSLSKR